MSVTRQDLEAVEDFSWSNLDVQATRFIAKKTDNSANSTVIVDGVNQEGAQSIEPAGGLDHDEAAMLVAANYTTDLSANASGSATNGGTYVGDSELTKSDTAVSTTGTGGLTNVDPDGDGNDEAKIGQPDTDHMDDDLLYHSMVHGGSEASSATTARGHAELFIPYMDLFGEGPVFFDEDTIHRYWGIQSNGFDANTELVDTVQLWWLVGSFDRPRVDVRFS